MKTTLLALRVGLLLFVTLGVGLVGGPLVAQQESGVPQITGLDFPERIQADGKPVDGLVFFADSDGDVAQVSFELLEGDHSTLKISPDWEFDPQVKGQTQGVIQFRIAATAGGSFKLQVTLKDEAGNVSAPEPLTFETVGAGVKEPAKLEVSPASLSFEAPEGSDPETQTLTIKNTGNGTMTWQTSDDANWLFSDNSGVLEPGKSVKLSELVVSSDLAAGDYQAKITVTAEETQGSPAIVDVTLTVTPVVPPAVLEVQSTTLSFDGAVGGANPTAQTLMITNSGSGTLNWTAQSDAGWIQLERTSGGPIAANNSESVAVSVNMSGLNLGQHQGQITITAEGAQNSPAIVTVTLMLEERPAVLEVSPTSLSFRGEVGGANPAPGSLRIENTGAQLLNWEATTDAAWLVLGATSSTLTPSQSTEVSVLVDIAGLTEGTHRGRITVTAPGAQGSPVIVNITLILEAQPAVLEVQPSSLSFAKEINGANLSPQMLSITNTGDQALSWSATVNAPWLNLSASRGNLDANDSTSVTISVSVAGLSVGTHQARITITAPGAMNSPQTVRVVLMLTRRAIPGGTLFVSSNGASFAGSGHGEITRIDLDTFISSFITLKTTVVRNLDVPEDGTCGPDSNVYFVDRSSNRVIRFDQEGRTSTKVAEISRPEGITFDANGDLFVSANDGIYLIPRADPNSQPQQVITHQFSQPGGIVFLTQGPFAGELLAVDMGADVVLRFPRNGSNSFGRAVTFISKGLNTPTGIALNSRGEVFVASFKDREILQFRSDGTSQGVLGAKVGLRLFRPIHLEFDGADNLFMAEWGDFVGQGWIAMFRPSTNEFRFLGKLVDAWGVALCLKQ